jgi:hypothetical protein
LMTKAWCSRGSMPEFALFELGLKVAKEGMCGR